AAESYALAISHLSDRLKGGAALVTAWPTDDPGMSRAQRLELQERLAARGYDIGDPDGRNRSLTREAIRKAEDRFGMNPTGRPGQKIFDALGAEDAPTAATEAPAFGAAESGPGDAGQRGEPD